jgi:hypothetical protein
MYHGTDHMRQLLEAEGLPVGDQPAEPDMKRCRTRTVDSGSALGT